MFSNELQPLKKRFPFIPSLSVDEAWHPVGVPLKSLFCIFFGGKQEQLWTERTRSNVALS
jgi:hypothetical protein